MTTTSKSRRSARSGTSGPGRGRVPSGLGRPVGDRRATAPASAASHTQARFRRLNGLILELRREADPSCQVDLVCECSDPRCFGNLRATTARYQGIRNQGSFAVLEDHPTTDRPALAA